MLRIQKFQHLAKQFVKCDPAAGSDRTPEVPRQQRHVSQCRHEHQKGADSTLVGEQRTSDAVSLSLKIQHRVLDSVAQPLHCVRIENADDI